MVDIHLGVNSGRDPGEQHPDENRPTPSAVKKIRADRQKKGDMSDVSTHRIEDTAQFRHAARHSRELSVRGVDDPMKDENDEARKAEPFIVEKRAPGDPDQRADYRKLDRTHAERLGRPSDDPAERPEEVNVTQLLDLDGLEGEVAIGHEQGRC